MRLLIFSPFYPPHIGGLESHSDEFNKHLAMRGIEISVFTPQLPIDAPKEDIRHKTVRIYRFPAFEIIHNYPVPKFWLPKFWSLLAKASSSKPDIVVSRTRFFSTSLFALLYAKFHRIPILHIEHGSDYAMFNSAFKTTLGKLYDRTLGWVVLRFANQIVANSRASANFVKKLSGRDALVIYRGIEMEKILSISPSVIPDLIRDPEFHIENKVVIGYLGRLIDGKGVADLLSALAKLNRDDFRCFIIGDGPEQKKLDIMAEQSSLNGKIRFFGHQEHSNAVAIMKTFDVFVNPSYGEGMPTAVTEAALCGKAIIATDVGGTPEIISGENDGILIPPKRQDILAEKIGFLLDHPEERKRLGENAKREVTEKFSWDRAADRYLEVFAELLENRKT